MSKQLGGPAGLSSCTQLPPYMLPFTGTGCFLFLSTSSSSSLLLVSPPPGPPLQLPDHRTHTPSSRYMNCHISPLATPKSLVMACNTFFFIPIQYQKCHHLLSIKNFGHHPNGLILSSFIVHTHDVINQRKLRTKTES